MESFGWRTQQTLIRGLLEDVQHFDFFQAMRLLKQWTSTAELRLRSTPDPGFPSGSLKSLKARGTHWELCVAFLGLTLPNGPLPDPYRQWMIDNLRNGDSAMADFLDIFNHRLIDLFYRVRQRFQVGLMQGTPTQTSMAHYLAALIGIATPQLERLLPVGKRQVLAIAGLLANRRVSLPVVQNVLALHLQTAVTVRVFQGCWEPMQPRQWIRLGESGTNQHLGRNTVVGQRVWNQQGVLQLEIGPLPYEKYTAYLLPSQNYESQELQQLKTLLDFLTQRSFHYRLVLTLDPQARQPSQLSTQVQDRLGWGLRVGAGAVRSQPNRNEGMELGWTSWLNASAEHPLPPASVQLEVRQDQPIRIVS